MKSKVNMYAFEAHYRLKGYKKIIGIDEVGRGAWAGPIVVAAVCLPSNYRNDEINDSKKLSFVKRDKLFDVIRKVAIDYSIVFIDPKTVDKLNPKRATIYGMEQAISKLKTKPDIVLIDAEKLQASFDTKSIIKGDGKSISIAAASILAKVSRDKYMEKIGQTYPNYKFGKHKGYGTAEHLKALKRYGPIQYFHRASYKPVQNISKFLK